jgi:hypothetical protein
MLIPYPLKNQTQWHESASELYWRPLVGAVSANFCLSRVPRDQRDESLRPCSRLSRPESLLFLPSSSSVVLTRMSGSRSWTNTSQKNQVAPGIEPGPLDL